MLNSPSVANTTVNNSVQFHCEYACISNAVALWFVEEKIDVDVNLDQISIKRSSNRDEACRNPAAADASILHYSEILEISLLTSFDHPIPVYCAYILACNNHVDCSPEICFSDLVGELQGTYSYFQLHFIFVMSTYYLHVAVVESKFNQESNYINTKTPG